MQSNEGRCPRQRPIFIEGTMTTEQMKIESVRLAIAMLGDTASPSAILEAAAAIFTFIAGVQGGS